MGLLRIGLTGGIGSGKSTVARAFAARGVPVLDADEIARELVQPGMPAIGSIVAAFGSELLRGGQLDRAALREVVFHDDRKRLQLEGILHPLVYRELALRAAQLSEPYGILCIPLLLETGRRDFVDRLLVVDCPVALQIERVMRRDGSSEDTIRRIIARQASREERVAAADDVILNDGEPAAVECSVERLDAVYRLWARRAR
ncbi:dephospho-CoA kinase [Methylotetracoccus oryzae]|uniref:dephospho-CoA kinase n=1 Tax=Methylotetracoccus oryzae TaxID=1919059 RepID=UPI001EEA89E2|nr:dephospho-CoA kinase [Methylotetracoccus oryzae]